MEGRDTGMAEEAVGGTAAGRRRARKPTTTCEARPVISRAREFAATLSEQEKPQGNSISRIRGVFPRQCHYSASIPAEEPQGLLGFVGISKQPGADSVSDTDVRDIRQRHHDRRQPRRDHSEEETTVGGRDATCYDQADLREDRYLFTYFYLFFTYFGRIVT